MRFSNAAALLAPFLANAFPVDDTIFHGYQMGVFFVNWVNKHLVVGNITRRKTNGNSPTRLFLDVNTL